MEWICQWSVVTAGTRPMTWWLHLFSAFLTISWDMTLWGLCSLIQIPLNFSWWQRFRGVNNWKISACFPNGVVCFWQWWQDPGGEDFIQRTAACISWWENWTSPGGMNTLLQWAHGYTFKITCVSVHSNNTKYSSYAYLCHCGCLLGLSMYLLLRPLLLKSVN